MSELPPARGPSLRMEAVQTPIIPVIADLIRKHPGTISLGQGVVYYGPPPQAFSALERFLKQPAYHKYQPVDGIEPLRERLAAKLALDNQVRLGQKNCVVVTAGGNMAFMNAVLAIASPGDEIILPRPFYFNHEMAVAVAGCRPVLAPTDENYQLDLSALRRGITPKTRAIVTVSPNNPTGAVYPEADLRAVNALCLERGLYHISDEAYEYFTYEGARHYSPGSAAGTEAHTISLFSLSKAYGFASWRIGYMVAPRGLLEAIKQIQDTILICPPVVSQFAALGALEAGAAYCQTHIKTLENVRQFCLTELGRLKSFCAVPPATGAFYFLLRLETDWDSLELAEALIRQFGVAVIPGSAFGIEHGCFLRIAYGALQKETVAEGVERLARGLEALVGG